MRAFYSDHFPLPLPQKHRFPVDKYRQLRLRILQDQILQETDVLEAPAATQEQLRRVHTSAYVDAVIAGKLSSTEMGRIGFPWSPELAERSLRSTGATIAAAKFALLGGCAANLAGGTHHAFADCGEGYCVFNDVACAIRELQIIDSIQNVMIIDCDVHQGNGTASIFADDDTVYTLSLHGAKNFPLRKVPGNLDIAFADGTEDEEYLSELQQALRAAFCQFSPECIFYLAGADPYRKDRFGKMKLTKAGLQQRDVIVLGECVTRSLPVTIAMAGGYSNEIADIVDIQSATIKTAVSLYRNWASTAR